MSVPFHDTDTWARQSPGGRGGAEAIDENRNIYRYEGLETFLISLLSNQDENH